jgi:fumarylacetoacetate (FAA) hydrolase
MGATPAEAAGRIRLVVQLNDWSLRKVGAREMRTGFGFLQAKPSTSFAPIAATPDELGSVWCDGRVHMNLHVVLNDERIGSASGAEMGFSFPELIAHCARTRRLTAGTIIGSGTVSNADRAAGSSCLAERRVIEMLDHGEIAVEDHAGHSKEIDHALERIAAIEKHLGLDEKIAA